MNFVADAIVLGVLFFIPWYKESSLIGLNCASPCFINDVENTYEKQTTGPAGTTQKFNFPYRIPSEVHGV